jgi:hypothetical protein
MNAAVRHRVDRKLGRPVVRVTGFLKSPEPLAVQTSTGDVALVELALNSVGELWRDCAPAHIRNSAAEQAHQQPEREVLAQIAPVGARGPIRKTVCHLFQVRDEREMTVVLGVVESVPDQEGRRRPKPDEAELRAHLHGQLLIQERADGQAPRPTSRQQGHQPLQGLPCINYILDQ